jgi:hypothetical protein
MPTSTVKDCPTSTLYGDGETLMVADWTQQTTKRQLAKTRIIMLLLFSRTS